MHLEKRGNGVVHRLRTVQFWALVVGILFACAVFEREFRTALAAIATDGHLLVSDSARIGIGGRGSGTGGGRTSLKIPDGFEFTPSLSERAPTRNLVVTMCVGPPLESVTPEDEYHVDDDLCLPALLQTHIFLHRLYTRLSRDRDEAEFAVLATSDTPIACRNALVDLGARVIVVPAIVGNSTKPGYERTYTKLQLWALESVYRRVLYLDADLFYFKRTPKNLFHLLDETNVPIVFPTGEGQVGKPEMVAVTGHKAGFNAGLMIFDPSDDAYFKLLEMMPQYGGNGDQPILNAYYNNTWTHLSNKWNLMNLHRQPSKIADVFEAFCGFHRKFWKDPLDTPEGRILFHHFAFLALELRNLQLQRYHEAAAAAISLTHFKTKSLIPTFAEHRVPALVPIVPSDFIQWQHMRTAKTKHARIALLPATAAAHAAWQPVTEHYAQMTLLPSPTPGSVASLTRTLAHLVPALRAHDWVWVVLEGARPVRPVREPVQLALDRWTREGTRLVSLRDCDEDATGGLLVHRDLLDFLAELVEALEVDEIERRVLSDQTVHRRLMKLVEGKSHELVKVDVHDLYTIPDHECHLALQV
ncbi:nucleotide-diphospho-sugar transferase [Chytriomyces sp. MP71]|nr:nucleotide-diphospho-sugar transferase [Chytriomyces sp. MP71]